MPLSKASRLLCGTWMICCLKSHQLCGPCCVLLSPRERGRACPHRAGDSALLVAVSMPPTTQPPVLACPATTTLSHPSPQAHAPEAPGTGEGKCFVCPLCAQMDTLAFTSGPEGIQKWYRALKRLPQEDHGRSCAAELPPGSALSLRRD